MLAVENIYDKDQEIKYGYINVKEKTTGTVEDVDGNIYPTVKVGNQWWMAENLKVTKYPNGTEITPIRSDGAWSELSINSKAYCWYDNQEINKNIYGALYTWSAAIDACPAGWHLARVEEWQQLVVDAGGEEIAGDNLKETGLNHWESTSSEVTNKFGFTALPGGGHYSAGNFGGIGHFGAWWSSPEDSNSSAIRWAIAANVGGIDQSAWEKSDGYSVRCVQNSGQ